MFDCGLMQQSNALGEGLSRQVLLAAGGLTGILQPVMAGFVPKVLRPYRGWSAQGIQSEPMA